MAEKAARSGNKAASTMAAAFVGERVAGRERGHDVLCRGMTFVRNLAA